MGARFVRLGIAGFKSFADPVSLDILPGLTGVVGPNGCGKSNVAEALRWAMGEGNARFMRGGEMDDVIFAGSVHRASRNLAEVSLTVEDDAQGLPPPFSGQAELQVVRRLERGAGSAYRVNGREARARDVQTLFADLASGARSSAMVSQGRVGLLVNARPDERRAVLEEAAGITGLHARRAEAETRLRAADANLERAEERRVLLEQQLDGLRGQAKQAARYRTVMTAALETEALHLSIQGARAEAAVTQAEAALASCRDAVHRTMVACSALAASLQRAQAALPALRERGEAARLVLDRARAKLDGLALEAARTEAALATAVAREAQIAKDLAHAQTVLQEAEGADERLVAEHRRLVAEQETAPASLEQARAELAESAAALREADEAARDASARASEAGARLEAGRHLLHQAEQRARRAQDAHARLRADRDRAAAAIIDPARLADLAQARARAEADRQQARAAQDQAEAERSRAGTTAAAARDAHGRLETARHRLRAETQALAEVLAVTDGERWPPMVDRMTVPAGLEAALGAALGEELGAAANPQAARHWRPMPAHPPAALPGPCLSSLVAGPDLLDRALAGIGLVESEVEGDVAQAGLLPGQALVSRAGAMWRWDGYTVRAGTPTAAAVRLQQRNRLTASQGRLAEAERAAAASLTTREEADRADRAAGLAEQQARGRRREAEAMAERARTADEALRAQAEAASVRLAALEEPWRAAVPEHEQAGAALAAAQAAHAALPDPAALRATAEAARIAVQAARTRDNAASRTLEALQRTEQGRRTRIGAIAGERENRRMRAADLGDRVIDLQARVQEAATERASLAAAPGRAASDSHSARAECATADAACRAALAEREAAEAAGRQLETESRAADQAASSAREALARAEMADEGARTQRAATLARIGERSGSLPESPPPDDVSAEAEERARARLQRLVRERDDMGPVNLRAEIEAEAIGADIALILREREDLSTAIAKLRGSIGHLNREGRERLTAVFQEVDRHFQALFSRLFGGGRAHLGLVGSDDPLQAGLEIYAQPPGKKLATLSLLSGGEQALTALSLIFAVFRCNPAPLCVLDEVDAPLDEANVERLCTLLSDMAQETGTRFLVVTHHQVTMARMDRLYGVTMQERGVSRLLSVALSHASDLVQAAE